MSNHAHAYDKILALLKSIAESCSTKEVDHNWRKCRHCLAVMELERADVRRDLGAFIQAVEAMDEGYGV